MFNRIKLEKIAPEIQHDWEKTHNCNLSQLQQKYKVEERFFWGTLVLIALFVVPILLIGFINLESNLMPYLVFGASITIFLMLYAAFTSESTEIKLTTFNEDAKELRGWLGEWVKMKTYAKQGAEDILKEKAIRIQFCERGPGMDITARQFREDMIKIYNLLADFGLVAPSIEKERPPLKHYFDSTRLEVKEIIRRMAQEEGYDIS